MSESIDSSDNNQEQNKAASEPSTPKIADNSSAQKPARKQTNPQAKTGALWFFTILNLLFLFGIIAGAYWLYLQWQNTQTDSVDETQLLSQQVGDFKQKLQSFELSSAQDKQSVQSSVNSLLEEVLASQQTIANLESKLADVSGRRPADWLLAEADYLVRMAGRKLWLENDVKTAMMMLKSADTRLEDLADPSLFPVRKLIAQDIQTLHQVNPIANSSIALALSGMIPQVEKLAIAAIQIPDNEADNSANELSEDVADWQSNIAKTWRAIVSDFVSVSRTEKPIQPYLAEKQQWLIKEQVKYALTQAQGAVLDDNETLFKASLQQATALIVEYYELTSTPVEQFLGALQELSSTSIEKNYPSSLTSQAALSDVIERRVEQVFTNKQTGEL